jgi:hypothetical protein
MRACRTKSIMVCLLTAMLHASQAYLAIRNVMYCIIYTVL